ncbi:hypothetical protein BGHDH14_bghG002438000001001 [Blumeria hordei DH14]|uniref:Uncharacterized protein n=1 Tax=Blumeria graminis f. sp. hordei (strain DH14) TaxID=546991 RepID=N1J9W2_BLUG1|nr:hypothetical protein BGHDH14_bghG002438000001001 [Blumeria hordei DH14]
MHQITDIHTRKGGSLSWARLICKFHDDLHGMKRSFRSKRSHNQTPWNRGQQIVHFTAGSFLETIPEEREIEDEVKEFVLDHIVTKNEECDATFDDEHTSGWDTTGITSRDLIPAAVEKEERPIGYAKKICAITVQQQQPIWKRGHKIDNITYGD